MGIKDFFSGMISKKPVEAEESFIFSSGKPNDRILMALAEDFKIKKGIKATETYKLAKRVAPEKLELCYRIDEIVARCVNFYALQIIGSGFELIDCSEKTKKYILEFIQRDNLMEKLEDVIRDMCIYGNGWLEKKFNADNELASVDYVCGKFMDLTRDYNEFPVLDTFGDITGYTFKDWNGKKTDYFTKQFAHFRLFGQGNELAIGFIEPLYHLIYDKINARTGISQAGWRAGNELVIAYIGDKPDSRVGYSGHKADPSFVSALADELEDIKGKHKLVVPHWAKIEKFPAETIDWTPLLNYFDTRICAGFGIPSEMVLGGIGRANRATLEVVVTRDLDKKIKSFQLKIANVLYDSIFSEFLNEKKIDEIPKIRWIDNVPADLNRLAKRLTEYIDFGIVNPDDVKEIVYKLEGFPTKKTEKEGEGSTSNLPELIPEFPFKKIKGKKKKLEELSSFVFERSHLEPEEVILFLKKMKTSFPDTYIAKMIDELIQHIILKMTGQQIPKEDGGLDKVQGDEDS